MNAQRISVIGAGAWGTALANAAALAGRDVMCAKAAARRLASSADGIFKTRSAKARAASMNCGSLSVTRAWSGVLVGSLPIEQISRLGASKTDRLVGGRVRFQ